MSWVVYPWGMPRLRLITYTVRSLAKRPKPRRYVHAARRFGGSLFRVIPGRTTRFCGPLPRRTYGNSLRNVPVCAACFFEAMPVPPISSAAISVVDPSAGLAMMTRRARRLGRPRAQPAHHVQDQGVADHESQQGGGQVRHGARPGAEEEGPPDLEQYRRVYDHQPVEERPLPEGQGQSRERGRHQQGYEDLPECPVGGEVLPFRAEHLLHRSARLRRHGEPEHAGGQREKGERHAPEAPLVGEEAERQHEEGPNVPAQHVVVALPGPRDELARAPRGGRGRHDEEG